MKITEFSSDQLFSYIYHSMLPIQSGALFLITAHKEDLYASIKGLKYKVEYSLKGYLFQSRQKHGSYNTHI